MTSGYILIGAILILGGIVAVSGDRIGTRVGKARLSLFKLRPRQTATLVTIVTGTLISASVLTLIFGASEQLRMGVFDLQKIQRKLSDTKENLARALEQKDRVQRELEVARNEQSEAKNLLSGINNSLKDELLKQSVATQNFKNTQQQLQSVSTERNELVQEVTEISRQRRDLKTQQQVIYEQVLELKQQIKYLDSEVVPLKQQIAINNKRKSQLQQRLERPTPNPNLISQIKSLQDYENSDKKLSQNLEQRLARSSNLEAQLQVQQTELFNLKTQIEQLDAKLAVRQAQLKEKDKQHQQLEREFQTRTMELKLRDRQLKKIELQIKINQQGLASLEREVNNIEREYQKIRQGNVGILRNQVLASTIIKSNSTETVSQQIDSLLAQANRNALQATNPNTKDAHSERLSQRQPKILEITPERLTQLKKQISGRQNYVVRIFSLGNYVVGDRNIQVFIDATPDRQLFARNEQIAEISIDPTKMNEEQIRQQLNILIVTAQLRARRAGILEDRPQIGDGQLATYVQFLDRIKKQKSPLEIGAIVERDTYTLGPPIIKLQAMSGRKVLFNT
ncbi:DUF3084 domain-containing protein [Chamaesiphon minutus]|uniref:DUF3084 domain-containing protein n=1 Tax=Chamaesiphon minutus (strain ATCC 27169 / PCC 6605) TaxID=1173020 RepID=K9UP20_CHAP6|nr:DUF3084 domain-containing protein [Chamaesiphon minutus]AFY96570.1 hypothetical protein Cha6605_5713 [Chamaesiphon minutus PCC 6605]